MDDRHRVGIDEIDAQHDEIHEVATSAIEAIRSGDKWHIVHYILVRLHELLRFHFAVEESIMQIFKVPDLVPHRAMHKQYLETIARIRDASLNEATFGDQVVAENHLNFLEHILDHDQRMVDYIRENVTHLAV